MIYIPSYESDAYNCKINKNIIFLPVYLCECFLTFVISLICNEIQLELIFYAKCIY